MKKTFMIINLAFFLIGSLLILGVLQPMLFMGLAKLIGHYPGVRVEGLLELGGLFLVLTTIISCLIIVKIILSSPIKNLIG
jgi:hypothetical protein